jgi:negative regulator of flagellin synthesis FlgM
MTGITNIGKYEQTLLSETAEKQGVTPATSTTEAAETERAQDDKVSLSSMSRDMQTAKDSVAAVPDVRQDKVDEIKQAVESGNYEIDPNKIAEKMLGMNVNEMAY